MNKRNVFTVIIAAIAVLAIGTGGAVAGSMVTSAQIKDHTVRQVDIAQPALNAFKAPGPRGAKGATGSRGPAGDPGAPGDSNFKDAYYATAAYDAGDTNAGAIATVACADPSHTALSGGVQTIGVGGDNAAVGSSFPGRMDWSTNTPKPGRFDGWIVQFDADHAPKKATVWALCVPRMAPDFDSVETYRQSD